MERLPVCRSVLLWPAGSQSQRSCMDITETIHKCRRGDTQAFGTIYDEFADRIFRYIKIKVQDQQQAEDILQDVFVKAWAGMQTIELQNLNFNAWLYKVASNTINDYFRKLYRRPQTIALEENLDSESVIDPQDSTSQMEHSPLLNKALEKLPSQYRQVLELRFMQDFSLEETARILGKTNLAIRLLQHRALKQLRTILKDSNAFQS